VLIAEIDKGHRYMRAVAINNEQSPASARFLLGVAVEQLLQPGKPHLVIRPTGGRCSNKY
jgi:hypothetical protein